MDPYLTRALEMTPRLAEREVRRPGANWDARPDPTRFSMREVIAHLADWEPIMLTRIQKGVDNPGGNINAYDEGKMAIDNNYAASDPLEKLFAWRQDREKTIVFINGLSEDDMLKRVVHPERGEMYVKDIAHMLVSHDVYHIEQLMTMDAAAGKSVDTW